MTSRFIAVVGPSGVGKDSVIAGLCAARPGLRRVRRVITRPAEAGGEDHEPEAPAGFEARRQAGEFILSWGAHGLFYGIPRAAAGAGEVIANLSRGVLAEAAKALPDLTVLNLTAAPETLAARLGARGRETAEGQAARLSRQGAELPQGLCVVTIANDGPLQATVATALAALFPVSR